MHTRTFTSAVVNSTSPQVSQLARMVAMILRTPFLRVLVSIGTRRAANEGPMARIRWSGRLIQREPDSAGLQRRMHVATARAGENVAMTTRLPSLRSPPIGFAHRGARAHLRENTLEAFSLAIRLGATGLETDVWRTADDQIVCDHDGVVRRLFFSRTPISEVPRAALPEHIPTLAEVYDSSGTDLPLSVDLKDPAAFDGLMAVAREHDAAERLWVCHEDLDLLIRWRGLAPDVNLVNSTRLGRLPQGAERRAAELARERISAINLRRADWTGGLTTLFHRFDVLAFGWDAQHDRHIADLVDMGIDALYSDHVDRMVEVIGRYYE